MSPEVTEHSSPPNFRQRQQVARTRTDVTWDKQEAELTELHNLIAARDADVDSLNNAAQEARKVAREQKASLEAQEKYIDQLTHEYERVQQELKESYDKLAAANESYKQEEEEHAITKTEHRRSVEKHAKRLRLLEMQLNKLGGPQETMKLVGMSEIQTVFEYAAHPPGAEACERGHKRRQSRVPLQTDREYDQDSDSVLEADDVHRRPGFEVLGASGEGDKAHRTEWTAVRRPRYKHSSGGSDPNSFQQSQPGRIPTVLLPTARTLHSFKLVILLLANVIAVVIAYHINLPALLAAVLHRAHGRHHHQHCLQIASPISVSQHHHQHQQYHQLTRCHTIAALCQLFPNPADQPFYTTALQFWEQKSTSVAYCPRPVSCSTSSASSTPPNNSSVTSDQQQHELEQQWRLNIAIRLEAIFMLISRESNTNPFQPKTTHYIHRQHGEVSTERWWHGPSSALPVDHDPVAQGQHSRWQCKIALMALESALGGAGYLEHPQAKGAKAVQEGLSRMCQSLAREM